MSDAFYIMTIFEAMSDLQELILSWFTFVNIKIIFVVLLILLYLITSLSKSTIHSSRLQDWLISTLTQHNEEKIKKLRELTKKGVDIKDFGGYITSDVDNITLINTLINSYSKHTYSLLVPDTADTNVRCSEKYIDFTYFVHS